MTVVLEGEELADDGMLIDFKELKRAVQPLIDLWDHATIADAADAELISAVERLGSRIFVLPYATTAENLCIYASEYLLENAAPALVERSVDSVTIRIEETETCYAQHAVNLRDAVCGQGRSDHCRRDPRNACGKDELTGGDRRTRSESQATRNG